MTLRTVRFTKYSVGRRREFDEDEALQAAMQVFWRLGFEKTSLTDLLSAMGLSKSSFYQAFQSKEALFERCLRTYADTVVGQMRDELQHASSGLAFVRATLMGVARDAGHGDDARRGCLVMNTANEVGQREPSLAKLVSVQVDRFASVFESALRRAKDEGEWTGDQAPKTVARFLLCTLTGLKTMVKAGASRANVRSTAEVALQALSAA